LVTGVFIVAFSEISLAMSCHDGCSEEAVTRAAKKEPVNVGNKICPVMGNKINEKNKYTYEYEGKVYNLCCAGCVSAFKSSPEKYIKNVEDELKQGGGHSR
jgi:YHS domain-containing protein